MDRKTVYAIIAVLLLSLALIFLLEKGNTPVQGTAEEQAPPAADLAIEAVPIPAASRTPASVRTRPAVTLIRSEYQEASAPLPETADPGRTGRSSPSAGGSGASLNGGGSAAGAAGSGVTVVDKKHPTETEAREMNQRGIVLW